MKKDIRQTKYYKQYEKEISKCIEDNKDNPDFGYILGEMLEIAAKYDFSKNEKR
jgi:hypothetical protein